MAATMLETRVEEPRTVVDTVVPAAAPARSRSTVETAVRSLRTALTAGALTAIVMIGGMSLVGAPETDAPRDELGLSASGLDRMLKRHRCSLTGFESDVIPRKAIVTHPNGITELVSFGYGWDVFEGRRPGRFVAPCLGRQHR